MDNSADTNMDWAVKNGDLDQIKSLAEKDKSLINKQLPNGRYPLCSAADYGHKDVIEYLINHGADVNVKDKYGISPLLAAIFENHKECVKLLLAKGASKSGNAPDGRSYIDCAETDDMKALLK